MLIIAHCSPLHFPQERASTWATGPSSPGVCRLYFWNYRLSCLNNTPSLLGHSIWQQTCLNITPVFKKKGEGEKRKGKTKPPPPPLSIYTQPATTQRLCSLSQQTLKECSIPAIPAPHAPFPLHPVRSGFPPRHPTEVALAKNQKLPSFFPKPIDNSQPSPYSSPLSLIQHSCPHSPWNSVCTRFLYSCPPPSFLSAISDAPSQSRVGSASSTNLRKIAYPLGSVARPCLLSI